jgi:hypothetical protein
MKARSSRSELEYTDETKCTPENVTRKILSTSSISWAFNRLAVHEHLTMQLCAVMSLPLQHCLQGLCNINKNLAVHVYILVS